MNTLSTHESNATYIKELYIEHLFDDETSTGLFWHNGFFMM